MQRCLSKGGGIWQCTFSTFVELRRCRVCRLLHGKSHLKIGENAKSPRIARCAQHVVPGCSICGITAYRCAAGVALKRSTAPECSGGQHDGPHMLEIRTPNNAKQINISKYRSTYVSMHACSHPNKSLVHKAVEHEPSARPCHNGRCDQCVLLGACPRLHRPCHVCVWGAGARNVPIADCPPITHPQELHQVHHCFMYNRYLDRSAQQQMHR